MQEFKNLFEYALEKEADNSIWDMWLSKYPYMEIGQLEPQSYKEFSNELKTFKPKTILTNEQIEAELLPMIEAERR